MIANPVGKLFSIANRTPNWAKMLPLALVLMLVVLLIGAPELALAAPPKVQAWVVEQENPWGKFKIYVTDNAIRVKGSIGGSLLARAPYWNVIVYNETDKVGRIKSFKEYTGTRKVVDLEKWFIKKEQTEIAGVKSIRCFRARDARFEAMMDNRLMYRSLDKRGAVKQIAFTYVADAKRLKKIPVAIWTDFLNLPKTRRFPLQAYLETQEGQKKFYLKTKSQKSALVDKRLFVCPEGLKRSKKPIYRIFGGNQLDDTAEYFFPKDDKK